MHHGENHALREDRASCHTLICLACLQDDGMVPVEDLRGRSFINIARKHDPNPTEYKGLQLWAAQQI